MTDKLIKDFVRLTSNKSLSLTIAQKAKLTLKKFLAEVDCHG